MLLPSIFGNDVFDDMMSFPRFDDFGDIDRKLYGKHADRVMKTDVREHDDRLDKDNKDPQGKLIRQERYAGAMQRSYYVGKELTEEDIKAKFENGVLSLYVPKKEPQKALPETKRIAIE